MTVHLMLEVTFLSDWAVGAGTGLAGDVDRAVAKDPYGLPMVPAKTLTGDLRDACEEAALALDELPVGRWHRWVDWLFGDQSGAPGAPVRRPRPAALSIRPATLPPDVQEAARLDARIAQAAVVVRPGVRIDRRTGVARDDMLRMEERALAGLVLTAPLTLDGVDEVPEAARTLLVAGALLLERIGGKRRRGAGRCTVVIPGLGTQDIRTGDPGEVPPAPSTASVSTATQPAAAGPHRARYQVTCLSPVVASAGAKGNIVQSLDYIPGSMLLPIVALSMDGGVAEAIKDGTLLVSDATPVVGSGRGLPVPMCVQKPKGSAGGLHNALHGEPKTRHVPVKAGWIDPGAALGAVTTVDLTENAHAVIDDATGRPEKPGGLYVQQAIPAGTVLALDLVAPKAVDLTGEHRVGRSKKDDYGWVRFDEVPAGGSLETAPTPAGPGGASEAGGDPAWPGAGPIAADTARAAQEPSIVTAWAVSDVLLMDDLMQPTTRSSALADALRRELRVELCEVTRVFHGVRRHESWSATWGLPRDSLVAVKAGSVLQMKVKGRVAAGEVRVGQRQAEGFGRVLINHPLLLHAPAASGAGAGTAGAPAPGGTVHAEPGRMVGTPFVPPPAKPADGEADSVLQRLWQRAVGDWIGQQAEARAGATAEVLGLDTLTRSQLGSLRQLAIDGRATLTPRGRLAEQLEKAREDPKNQQLCDLGELLGDPERAWRRVGYQDDAPEELTTFAEDARRAVLLHAIRSAPIASQLEASHD